MGAVAFPADFGNPLDSYEFLKAQVLACLRRTQMNARAGAAKTRMVQEVASEVERRAGTERFSAARMRAADETPTEGGQAPAGGAPPPAAPTSTARGPVPAAFAVNGEAERRGA